MAQKQTKTIIWNRCRGRNGWDPPQDVREDMATEVYNIDISEGGLGEKRAGMSAIGTWTGVANVQRAFGGYVPGQDATARQLFVLVNSSAEIRRMAGSSTISSALTLPHAIATEREVGWAPLNGKLFISYDGNSNRLKVFDPGLSTTAIRFAGLGTAAAPSVADTGAGTYAAITRYYKVAFTEVRGGVTVRRGELSAASVIQPSGTGTHVRITKPAALSEGETHWEIYGSVDGTLFYGPITTAIAVGTTTYDDNSTVANWADNFDAAPIIGENKPFPSVKFLYSNGSRLFGFGVWETAAGDSLTPQAGTVYFSPVLDSSGIHDEERCRDTATQGRGALVLGRNAGGVDRAINGFGNIVCCFQSDRIYAILPTESLVTPYRRILISDTHGACSQESTVRGHDEFGRECLYFLDQRIGPCRVELNANGLPTVRWCGKDVADLWTNASANTPGIKGFHGIYDKHLKQVWWFYGTNSTEDLTDNMFVLDVTQQRMDEYGDLRGGWMRYDGSIAFVTCSTMMSGTVGATMGVNLVPWVAYVSTASMSKRDTSVRQDSGANYQAYVQSKAWDVEPLHHNKEVRNAYLLAAVSSGVTITQTFIRNFGDETNRTDSRTLTAVGSETRVLRRMENTALVDAFAFQVRLGDTTGINSSFTLDRWYGEVEIDPVPRR